MGGASFVNNAVVDAGDGIDRLEVYIACMPELPEVETTVRGLAAVMEGKRIAGVEARRADLRRPFPEDLRQRLTGATVSALGRRAKYGLIETDRGDTMIFHLGMSGRWRIDPEELGTHDHLIVGVDSGHILSLNDPRRFGSVDLVPTADIDTWPPFAAMGPEPLGPDFTARHLQQALAGRIASIKLLLLGGVSPASGQSCSNTCNYASDGDCDDGGPGSEYTNCNGAFFEDTAFSNPGLRRL